MDGKTQRFSERTLRLSNIPHNLLKLFTQITILFFSPLIVHVVKTLELSIPFILQYHHIKPRLNTVFDVLLYSFFFLFSLYLYYGFYKFWLSERSNSNDSDTGRGESRSNVLEKSHCLLTTYLKRYFCLLVFIIVYIILLLKQITIDRFKFYKLDLYLKDNPLVIEMMV